MNPVAPPPPFKLRFKSSWLFVGPWWMLPCLMVFACSLALRWDDDERPCEKTTDGNGLLCKADFSCLDNKCISDGTQERGQPCVLDRQCKKGLVCPACLRRSDCRGANLCAEPCQGTQAYLKESACPAGYVCKPYYNALESALADAQRQLIAACVPSDNCATFSAEGRIMAGQNCDLGNNQTGGVCIAVSNTATVCLPRCELSFSLQTGTPNPSCDGTEVCALVGGPLAPGYKPQQLACLYNRSIVPEQDDEPCSSPFHMPCERPSTCVNGFCRKYCRLTGNIGEQSNCEANKRCCAFPYLTEALSTTVGYCLDVGQVCPAN